MLFSAKNMLSDMLWKYWRGTRLKDGDFGFSHVNYFGQRKAGRYNMTRGMTGLLCCGHKESRPGLEHHPLEEDERHMEQNQEA